MCGIAGAFYGEGRRRDDAAAIVGRMVDTLAHRGPDDRGCWSDPDREVCLGHRRLSIVDLSPLGHQPMVSRSGRWVLSFNGEVYNHAELRHRLEQEGGSFHGRSDTEVLVEAIDAWGLTTAMERSNAMFALAAWDRRRRELHLARDRVGEKPLFYAWAGQDFIFASEMKAIVAHPQFSRCIDRGAVALLMRHNCVPAPHSIFVDAGKLMPGATMVVTEGSLRRRHVEQAQWWSAAEASDRAMSDGRMAPPEWADRVESVLLDSVRLRTQADVPVGAFLSGGIDSSLIVALMQQVSSSVKTFSIGFEESGYDESSDARLVARHLGTDHTELVIGTADAQAVIPRLADVYDEPFADSSQIPTVLVSELARRQVKVVLSGDGGDELFGGYNRHQWCERIAGRLAPLPTTLRRAAGHLIGLASPELVDGAFELAGRFVPAARVRNPSVKVSKLAGIMAMDDPGDMYRRLTSHWSAPERLVMESREPETLLSDRRHGRHLADSTERMLFMDMTTYLPDDILTKVDRATMAASLEGRIPFLDPRVVDCAWRLPLAAKLGDGQTKWVLRRVLDKYVPSRLVDRPKMGFGVPLRDWLRGDLREWAEELLRRDRLDAEGFLASDVVARTWRTHVSGAADNSAQLWDVLMFQAWQERWTRPAATERGLEAADRRLL